MQDDLRRSLWSLAVGFTIIYLLSLLLHTLEPMGVDKNSSNSLSTPVVRGNEVYVVHKNGYISSNSISHHIPQVLASNTGEKDVVDSFQVEVSGYASLDPRAKRGVCYSGDPSITASGEKVRRGVVAANFLDFGTKIRIPEYFGDEVFVVKDRMASEYGWNIDVWMKDQDDAKELGRVTTKIEIIK